MTTTTLPTTAPLTAVSRLVGLVEYLVPQQRLLLTDVGFADFVRLAEWRDESHRGSVRLAYDHGDLEIMVVSNAHERFRKVIATLIETWLVETGGEYVPSGQLTHRREDLERGFEPDECYYLQNWQTVAGIREVDFAKDPPPDLTVEIEASRNLVGRLPIYAAFKIPEVWRYNGERLTVLLLQSDGSYEEASVSRALPKLPLAEFQQFLILAEDRGMSFATIARRFREWVRTLPVDAPKT